MMMYIRLFYWSYLDSTEKDEVLQVVEETETNTERPRESYAILSNWKRAIKYFICSVPPNINDVSNSERNSDVIGTKKRGNNKVVFPPVMTNVSLEICYFIHFIKHISQDCQSDGGSLDGIQYLGPPRSPWEQEARGAGCGWVWSCLG